MYNYEYENNPAYIDYLVSRLEDECMGRLLFITDHADHELECMHALG